MFKNYNGLMAEEGDGAGGGGAPPAGTPPPAATPPAPPAGTPPPAAPPAGKLLDGTTPPPAPGAGTPPPAPGAGTPPPAPGAGTPPPAGELGAWSWAENVPGEGTVPPWLKTDKFKSVADQAKGYSEVETKLGPAAKLFGAPEGDYVMPGMPEGIEGEWDTSDGILVGFQKVAKEMGLSQAAHDQIALSMAEMLAAESSANETAVSDALAQLGTNSSARIEAVKGFLTAKLGEDGYTQLNDSVGTNVKAYLALEGLVSLAAGDAQLSGLPGQKGPAFNKSDIDGERYKVFPEGNPLAGKVMYEHDAAHRTKVDGMYKELFPGEDVQTVG